MAAHLVLLVPYPAQGHITPMLRLGRVLHARGFRPVLVTPDFIHRRITADTDSTDSEVSYVSIPTGLRADNSTTPDFAGINRAMEENMPAHFEILLQELNSVAAVVIVDLLASWAIGVSVRCDVPVVGFWPAMLATYGLISAIPELIHKGFITNFGTPVQEKGSLIPGHEKLSTKDLPWLIGDSNTRKSRFTFWLKTLARSSTLQCLLINSFHSEVTDYTNPVMSGPELLPIGPLLNGTVGLLNDTAEPSPSLWTEDNTCIPWLESQRPNSVIYVSFGSWVAPIDKLYELILGLESSHRPFIWVIPDAWRNSLPPSFLNRAATTSRGKVVTWAPQEAVLKHKAVGCYITHCGWNSTIEAIRCGKRMLCYPVSGDQFVNAKYIVDVWRVGLRLSGVERKTVREGVWRVMEGEEGKQMEERMIEFRKRVMSVEEICKADTELQMCLNEALKKIVCRHFT